MIVVDHPDFAAKWHPPVVDDYGTLVQRGIVELVDRDGDVYEDEFVSNLDDARTWAAGKDRAELDALIGMADDDGPDYGDYEVAPWGWYDSDWR